MANVPRKFHWDILKTRPKFSLVLLRQEEDVKYNNNSVHETREEQDPIPFRGWDNNSINTRATGPGAQLAIPSLTRIWLGDRDRE